MFPILDIKVCFLTYAMITELLHYAYCKLLSDTVSVSSYMERLQSDMYRKVAITY